MEELRLEYRFFGAFLALMSITSCCLLQKWSLTWWNNNLTKKKINEIIQNKKSKRCKTLF